jgi:hypothetical protein
MAAFDYPDLVRFVYDWQTFIAGMGAIYGGWLAYRAGIRQANTTSKSAEGQIKAIKEQTAAIEQQNADLKLADQRKLARERLAVAGLLYTSLGFILGQIETARSMFSVPADNLYGGILIDLGGKIRHEVGKPGFAYLWERLGVFEGEIVADFLSLEIALDRMQAEKRPTSVRQISKQLDYLETLATRLRDLASGEMKKARGILSEDDLSPPQ